ncbi:hypothetical protein ACFYVL_33290 [Streptomyces sp. NPDC004111]|uniref:hypothetical protein n=1 Tax=Streptomyces sp. NPDC004111 TaxID=3364690 RepID=UPI0036C03198
MIQNFAHKITADVVEECDTDSAAEIAAEHCPNPDATVTHLAMDMEHARFMVTVERQILDIEEMVVEKHGEDEKRATAALRTIVDRLDQAEQERAQLRAELNLFRSYIEEVKQVLEIRTETFHRMGKQIRQEMAATRTGMAHAALDFMSDSRTGVFRTVKNDAL